MLMQLSHMSLAAVHHMFEKFIRTHDKPVSACFAAMPPVSSLPASPHHAAPADVDSVGFPTASGLCSRVVSSCVPILWDHQCCLGELAPCCGLSELTVAHIRTPSYPKGILMPDSLLVCRAPPQQRWKLSSFLHWLTTGSMPQKQPVWAVQNPLSWACGPQPLSSTMSS